MSTAATSAAAPSSPAAAPASILVRDFPGWLPPMLVKELRQGLRTRGFVGTLLGFQVVMLLVTLIALGTQSSLSFAARQATTALSGFFWVVMAVQLLVFTPSRALGGLQQEVDLRTLDLLLLTRLTAWRVVLGKWISLLAQATLMVVAMLPYLAVRYFTENANPIDDLGRSFLMLGVSAVLTAAALWGSGVGKLVRIVMAIALAFVLLNAFGAFGVFMGGRMTGMRPAFLPGLDLPFDIFNGVCITAFFLVSAVRNIAPPAENHALSARVIPLLSLLPVPFAEALGAHALAERQLFISGVFLGLVLLFEFGGSRRPMATHWREWHRRGAVSRVVGRLSLPGWESVLGFAAIVTVVWAGSALLILSGPSATSMTQATRAAWLAVLALTAMTCPVFVRSLLNEKRFPPSVFYFFGLALPTVLAMASAFLAESRWRITGFRTLMETLPFSSFLFGIARPKPFEPAVFFMQAIVAVLVIGGAAWRTRGYWQQLRAHEERDRAAASVAASEGPTPVA